MWIVCAVVYTSRTSIPENSILDRGDASIWTRNIKTYLGLGSALGDRKHNLARGLAALETYPIRVLRVAPVVESPALLPERSPSDWNRPYLNTVVECECQAAPQQVRDWTRSIQHQIAGNHVSRWSPRVLDVDLLAYGDSPVRLPKLKVPARDIHKRAFVVSPLVHLQPDLRIPGKESRTVFEWSALLNHHLPLWMGIVNITPDSFSDGGLYTQWSQIEPHLEAMIKAGVHIIDLGAESTRPGATQLSADAEWTRLQPVLERTLDMLGAEPLPPRISVDTRTPEVAAHVIERGVGIVNDVGGLSNPAMLELACSSDCEWVVMHHLTIPANPKVVIDTNEDPLEVVESWLQLRLEQWDKAGLNLNRIILDPGIGFGKNALQSLELMRGLKRLRSHGLRLLIGHSRKSFMHGFAGRRVRERDLTTIGVSLALCQQGADIIRVHDVPGHVAAYRGWAHLQCHSLRRPKAK